MSRPPKHGMPADELARLAGVAESTLKLHMKAGAPMPRSPNAVQSWLPKYHNWRDRQRRTSGPAPGAIDLDPEILANRRERGRLQNMSMRIDLAVQQKQLIRIDDVRANAIKAILACNAHLDAIKMRLAAQLGPCCQGGEAFVLEQIDIELTAMRADFASGMGRAAEDATASRSAATPEQSRDESAGTSRSAVVEETEGRHPSAGAST